MLQNRNFQQTLHFFKDAGDAADAGARFILKSIDEILAIRTSCSLALSGGNSPRSLYRRLAETGRGNPLWKQVHFFWGDERLVPVTDKNSNYRMAMESLLEPLGIDQGQIHKPPVELPPEMVAEAYAADIARYLRDSSVHRQGAGKVDLGIDICILGMGSDGHTASLFPGSPALAESGGALSERLVVCVPAPDMEPRVPRLSLSLPFLRRSGTMVFFITGDKREVLAECVRTGWRPAPDLPVTLVVQDRSAVWYISGDGI